MEIERMFFVMAHVLCLVVAAIGIALADLSLFRGQQVDHRLLRAASLTVMWALLVLWLSGMAIIWIDTRLDFATLAASPKLITKLFVALLLTFNGVVLHWHFFGGIGRAHKHPLGAANLSAFLAAVSGASWLYAAFLGLARALTHMLSLAEFMALYVLVLAVSGLFVARVVRPRILRIYLPSRQA
jgi:hypothetical protein